MKRLSISLKIYIALIIILAILAATNVFLPQGLSLPQQELPASKPVLALVNAAIMLALYGGLGLLGLKLAQTLGFPELWDENVSNRQRFLTPFIIGVCLGLFFILADAIFSQFHSLGQLPHPPFPTSIVASAIAGIGEELLFRLFLISFLVWLVSHVILKGKGGNLMFWIAAIFSALIFAFGHLPAVMILFGFATIAEIPAALLSEIMLLNSIVSLFAAYYLRKSGFLAPIGIHFWTDIVWHAVWGLVGVQGL
jgi:membrane protease YdiL (CAAX protease family)